MCLKNLGADKVWLFNILLKELNEEQKYESAQ